MIQKSNFFLLQITQNGPIRENKWFKPKSETFHFLSPKSLVPDLVIFSRKSEIADFGHFLEFGTSDRAEIAYFDSTK